MEGENSAAVGVGNEDTAEKKQGDGKDFHDEVREMGADENQNADEEDFEVMDGKHSDVENDDAIDEKHENDEDDEDVEDDNEAEYDEGDESPSRKLPSAQDDNDEDDNSHPYIGKRVKILFGPHKGSVGTVVALRSRGWWKLDNQDGLVHSRRCQMLDTINPDDMVAYYEKHGKKYRGTPVLDGYSSRRRKASLFNAGRCFGRNGGWRSGSTNEAFTD